MSSGLAENGKDEEADAHYETKERREKVGHQARSCLRSSEPGHCRTARALLHQGEVRHGLTKFPSTEERPSGKKWPSP